jgi:hypothetical protein
LPRLDADKAAIVGMLILCNNTWPHPGQWCLPMVPGSRQGDFYEKIKLHKHHHGENRLLDDF